MFVVSIVDVDAKTYELSGSHESSVDTRFPYRAKDSSTEIAIKQQGRHLRIVRPRTLPDAGERRGTDGLHSKHNFSRQTLHPIHMLQRDLDIPKLLSPTDS